MAGPALATIGYERVSQRDVIDTLLRAGIGTLIDVRDRAQSRRAGFSKTMLAASLAEAGIGYVHLRTLGTPAEGREANRRRHWEKFWAIVEARLETPEAQLALQQAAELAQAGPCCLLCYEADPHICHRARVADILSQRHGFTTRHLTVGAG